MCLAYASDDYSSAYPSDSHGRSVTPLIVVPDSYNSPPNNLNAPHNKSSSASAPFKPSLQPTASPPVYDPYDILPHGKSKEEAEASEELMKLKVQKQLEGGILGREGGRLCNEKRRRGFLDGEEFWDLGEDSD